MLMPRKDWLNVLARTYEGGSDSFEIDLLFYMILTVGLILVVIINI